MNGFIPAVLDFIFPPLCHICRSFIPDAGELHICQVCRERLPLVVSPLCTVCGIPFIGAGDDHHCGQCLAHPPYFDCARSSLLYEGAAREMIHSFKYSHRTHLRRPLALIALEGLADFILEQNPDVIIPVPLYRSRIQERGFNQAVLLGELFSARLSIAMLPRGLTRIRQTEPQIELSADERRSNVKGAFAVTVPESVVDRRIVLLDDVMTTGSTVNECARELKKSGAKMVLVITVARTGK